MLNSFVFSSCYLLIGISAAGIAIGGTFTWTGVFLIFTILPILEFSFPNFKLKQKPIVTEITEIWLFISPVILSLFTIWSGFKFVGTNSIFEKWGLALSVGSLNGALGITIAHELVHRKESWQRGLGVWNLLLVNFGHWGIEHVFGHHKNVGTPADHASATKNQWLYSFWLADYFGGLRNSYQFEKKRISGKPFSAVRNRIVLYALFSVSTSVLISFFSISFLIFWWAQSLIAILLLLSVDYIEHYGLQRSKKENGLYEPVNIQHSWDTEAFLTNALLFNLGLHSHHHMKARLHYEDRKSVV